MLELLYSEDISEYSSIIQSKYVEIIEMAGLQEHTKWQMYNYTERIEWVYIHM